MRVRWRQCQPSIAKPISMVAQVPGSGTAEGSSTGPPGPGPGNVAGGGPPEGPPGSGPGSTIPPSVGGGTPSSSAGAGGAQSTLAETNAGVPSRGLTTISVFEAAEFGPMPGLCAGRDLASTRDCLVLVLTSSPELRAPGERSPMRSPRLCDFATAAFITSVPVRAAIIQSPLPASAIATRATKAASRRRRFAITLGQRERSTARSRLAWLFARCMPQIRG